MPHAPEHFAVVILAAGLGSRLGSVTQKAPKWMVQVSENRTLAEHQLDAVDEAFDANAERHVITGAHSAAIDDFVATRNGRSTPSVSLVHNEKFEQYNNWYSLLMAFERLDAANWEGWTIVMNGDLLCPSDWIGAFRRELQGAADVVLAVDSSKPTTDESMKVAVADDRMCGIGKANINNPYGEYIGLAAFSPNGRARVGDALRRFESSGEFDEWYEAGIRVAAEEGLNVAVWDTPAEPWVEIDDAADLENARVIASKLVSGGA